MAKIKKVGKEAVELLKDTLYGDFLIKSFDMNFLEHTITMVVVLARPVDIKTKRYKEEQYVVKFTNVSKFKLEKSDADEPWEGLWWAYLWYLPEDKSNMNLTKEERKEIEIEKYNFLIEGDFYYFLIKGNLEVEPYESN